MSKWWLATYRDHPDGPRFLGSAHRSRPAAARASLAGQRDPYRALYFWEVVRAYRRPNAIESVADVALEGDDEWCPECEAVVVPATGWDARGGYEYCEKCGTRLEEDNE